MYPLPATLASISTEKELSKGDIPVMLMSSNSTSKMLGHEVVPANS